MSELTKIETIHVNIGQLHACRSGPILKTLLGSCVSACLYDPVVKVAGMNHILLSTKADVQTFDSSARYGIHAMEILINEMLKLGAKRSRLQAKAFGGGNVLATANSENSPGQRNVEFLLEFLRFEKISLLAYDFGGPWTRVLQFHTDTFDVFVKKTQNTLRTDTIDAETRLQTTISKKPEEEEGGEITLFD